LPWDACIYVHFLLVKGFGFVFDHCHTAQRMNRVSILPRADGNGRFDVLTGQNGQKSELTYAY